MVPGSSEMVLVVDDEPQIGQTIRDAMQGAGVRCALTVDSAEAMRRLDEGNFRVLVADVALPGISGLDLLAHVHREHPGCRVILMTGFPDPGVVSQALLFGAHDYFTKPFDIEHMIRTILEAVRLPPDQPRNLLYRAALALYHEDESHQAVLESVAALAQAVEAKDPYTRRHSEQVCHYANAICRQMALPEDQARTVHTASLLHDIGKIGVPDHILTKPGPLTEQEFRLVRRHAALGAKILQNISILTDVAKVVRHHHERWDGAGYPDGLSGQDIPVGARIIGLADALDSMLMERTYKPAYSPQKVLEEVEQGAGT